jgi:hypothetical protein
MRDRMECYLETPSSWIDEFEYCELERIGFVSDIREGGDLLSAYEKRKSALCIGKEAENIISNMLSELGDGYLGTELNIINSALDKLSKIESAVSSERENKARAAGALLGAVAAGVVILII